MRYLVLTLALIPTALNEGVPRICPFMPKVVKVEEIKIDPQEHKCLATMIYGEARGEPEQGMVAVAYTAVNRAVKKRICQVVLAPKQYSIFNDNPALRAAALSLKLEPKQKNIIDKAGWEQSLKVATAVLRGDVTDPTNGSTYYIADKVMKQKHYQYPRWTKEFKLVVEIENHKFYKPIDKPVVVALK